MQFEGEAAHRPPFVLRGDNLSASTYWHGKLMNQWARDWVKYQTDGKGTYAICGMEDTGTLQSLTWLAQGAEGGYQSGAGSANGEQLRPAAYWALPLRRVWPRPRSRNTARICRHLKMHIVWGMLWWIRLLRIGRRTASGFLL